MSPKEKATAILDLQRFARGIYEKKIDRSEVDAIVKPVSELGSNGSWQLKASPTRMEIDQLVANCKDRADRAAIPKEPFELNIAEELKKAIHSPI